MEEHFTTLAKEYHLIDSVREDVIKKSRDVVKAAKSAINNVHRNKYKEFDVSVNKSINTVKDIERQIKSDDAFSFLRGGVFSEAMEELVEGIVFEHFVRHNKILLKDEVSERMQVTLTVEE